MNHRVLIVIIICCVLLAPQTAETSLESIFEPVAGGIATMKAVTGRCVDGHRVVEGVFGP